MTEPRTLRGYEAAHQAINARIIEITHREPVTREERIAFWRDLAAAREEMRDLYRAAALAAPPGPDGKPGLVWSALADAADHCESQFATARDNLARLQTEEES